MRITPDDFQKTVTEALKEKESLSPAFEQRMLAAANELLTRRRDLLAVRASERAMAKERRSFLIGSAYELTMQLSPGRVLASVASFLAMHPAVQAAAILVLTSVALFIHSRPGGHSMTFADLPELPKYNDSPARYDSQWLQERLAYEREVEDAHAKTSGGI